jgi:hypothetical protein
MEKGDALSQSENKYVSFLPGRDAVSGIGMDPLAPRTLTAAPDPADFRR